MISSSFKRGVESSAPTSLSEDDIDKLAAKLFVFGFDGNGTEPAEHARRLIAKGLVVKPFIG